MTGIGLPFPWHDPLGLALKPDQLTFTHMSLRAFVVFVAMLAMVRLSHRRFLARLSAFDAIVGFVLASTLSRAINGSASFWPTLACGFVIIAMHRLLTALAFRFPRFGDWIKGRPDVLVQSGRADAQRMRAHGISHDDVLEEARLNAGVDHISGIERATLERNGQVSVLPKRPHA
jgi:uncharacterized membrane protein YcaP (DUF421 family)